MGVCFNMRIWCKFTFLEGSVKIMYDIEFELARNMKMAASGGEGASQLSIIYEKFLNDLTNDYNIVD